MFAIVGAAQGLFVASSSKSSHSAGGDIGSVSTLLLFGGIVSLPIIIYVITRFIRNTGDDDTDTSNTADTPMAMNAADSNYTADEADDDQNRRTLIVGLAAALAAIGIALFAYASTRCTRRALPTAARSTSAMARTRWSSIVSRAPATRSAAERR